MLVIWWENPENLKIYEVKDNINIEGVHNNFLGEDGLTQENEDRILELGQMLDNMDPIYDSTNPDLKDVITIANVDSLIVTGQFV